MWDGYLQKNSWWSQQEYSKKRTPLPFWSQWGVSRVFNGRKTVSQWMLQKEYWSCQMLLNKYLEQLQGLFIRFLCVGSGDPVRVLHLYTMNTLDTLWSIYCWDICKTCHYWICVLLAQPLQLWDFLLLIRIPLKHLVKCAPTLYCVVTYIYACVDASRTVFWDRSVLC